MSATDEQFAAAYHEFRAQEVSSTEYGRARVVSHGRAMLAALEAHGCIPKPQGLTARQDLVARLMCSDASVSFEAAIRWADQILALGEPQ